MRFQKGVEDGACQSARKGYFWRVLALQPLQPLRRSSCSSLFYRSHMPHEPPGAPGSSNLLVLLHGIGFRVGDQLYSTGRQLDFNTPPSHLRSKAEQQRAIESITTNVLKPAWHLNWSTHVFVDAVVPKHFEIAWRQLLYSRLPLIPTLAAERTTPEHTGGTQAHSLLKSMLWVAQHPNGRAAWTRRDVLLLTRLELILKMRLPMPPPPDNLLKRMLIPFYHVDCPTEDGPAIFDDNDPSRNAIPGCLRIASDTMLWVPRQVHTAFEAFLADPHKHPYTCRGAASHTSECTASNAVDTARGDKVSFHDLGMRSSRIDAAAFLPKVNADANPARTWNPLYDFVGRQTSSVRLDPGLLEGRHRRAAVARGIN